MNPAPIPTRKRRPTCFVISPIGPDDSEIRRNANDFLELLIQPALDKFDFEVIRADKIARPTVITADIIRLVQEAELCVVELSGNNPNVFYECGRRHESGKPFIQLVRKEEATNLPFDVAGIRTVIYDLSSPRLVLESQRQLKDFVQSIVDAGFGSSTSGVSLTSIAQGIERVDRKLGQLVESVLNRPNGPSGGGGKWDSIEMAMKPPHELFRDAIQQGRIDLAFQVLPRIRQANGYKEYIGALGVLTAIGDDKAFSLLETEIDALLGGKAAGADELIPIAVQVLFNYFRNTGKGKEGVDYLARFLDRMIGGGSHTQELKASIANKIGMLAWLIEEDEICIKYTKVAIDFNSEEPAFHYNLSLVYAKIGATAELEHTLAKLNSFPQLDEDHKRLLRQHGFRPKE